MLDNVITASVMFFAGISAPAIFFILFTPRPELAAAARRTGPRKIAVWGGFLAFFYVTLAVLPAVLGAGMAAEDGPTADCGTVWDGRFNGRDCR